jgi:hypothetical protein
VPTVAAVIAFLFGERLELLQILGMARIAIFAAFHPSTRKRPLPITQFGLAAAL